MYILITCEFSGIVRDAVAAPCGKLIGPVETVANPLYCGEQEGEDERREEEQYYDFYFVCTV